MAAFSIVAAPRPSLERAGGLGPEGVAGFGMVAGEHSRFRFRQRRSPT